ncbi:response regulator [Rhodopseudomonas palustris]|uniref:Response regulator n=1 Tax=Rhodopseudomonas palustris TaxID=1076 RepID=A0A323UDE6_RHOPL|nr:response regulator [Rhodopseudomonas palustris]PZA10319.1 response regulator [Rhodopseudomonas palustris]
MQKTVLIVEDEFLIAMDLARMVEADGWTVIGPVGTVKEALRLLEEGLPTVAMLDVNLGSELVTPVAERLTASNVPVASAYDKPEHQCGDLLAGVPNVGKPTSERRVLSTLRLLIEI